MKRRIIWLVIIVTVTLSFMSLIGNTVIPASATPTLSQAIFFVQPHYLSATDANSVDNVTPLDFDLRWVIYLWNEDPVQNISHVTLSANASNVGPIIRTAPEGVIVDNRTYTLELDNFPPRGPEITGYDTNLRLYEGGTDSLFPGFASSRQVDKEIFESPGTQTVIATVTPDHSYSRIGANVAHSQLSGENELVSWALTEGLPRQSTMNPTSGVSYNYTFTFWVTPKAGPVRFLPEVRTTKFSNQKIRRRTDVTTMTIEATDNSSRTLSATATTSEVVHTFRAFAREARDVNYNRVTKPYVIMGDNVTAVDNSTGVSVCFEQVNEPGDLLVDVTDEEPIPTTGFEFFDKYYDISTTANYSGPLTVTIAYDDTGMTLEEEEALRLCHENGSTWEDVTVLPVDIVNDQITGVVTSFSGFAVGTGPKVTWLPPLATNELYLTQDGSTVPIKFQLTDVNGNLVSDASVTVSVTDSEGYEVLSGLATYEPDIPGYRINAQTKGWGLGDYTINVSVPSLYLGANYGLSIVEKGQAKGKQK